jgi:PTS system nitrogen regulatory IIA component
MDNGGHKKTLEPLLTLSDVALRLNVAEKTVLRMLQREEIPAYRVGNQWRFQPAELQMWLEGSSTGPTSVTDLLKLDHTAVHLDRLLHASDIVCYDNQLSLEQLFADLASRVAVRFASVDPDEYASLLAEREQLADTRLTDSLMTPHVRDVTRNPAGSATLLLSLLPEGLLERPGVRIVALVCSDDLVIHLRLLQKISYLFRDEALGDQLAGLKDPARIYRRIFKLERGRTHE